MVPAVKQKRDPNVRFVRIKGRVVPIRTKAVSSQNAKEAAKGAAFVGAGAAVGAASGKVYKTINSIATRGSYRAFRSLERITAFTGPRQGNFFSMVSKSKAQNKALGALNKARMVGKAASPFRIGGQLAASALIGIGAKNLYKAMKDENPNEDLADMVGSSVAAGAFLVGTHGAAGLRTSIKPLFVKVYPHLRKLKGLLKL